MALPASPTLDLTEVQQRIARHSEKRQKLLDRSAQLAVVPGARHYSREKGGEKAWAHTPMPSDPPIIQMLLYLSEQLESGDWKKIEDDFKRCQMQNQITKQMTDLLDSLEDKSSGVFEEMCTLVNQSMRAKEHADKMAVARDQKEDELSDAELIRRAKDAGIPLVGESE